MSVRYRLTISDNLKRAIAAAAGERGVDESEILRRAFTLYFVARDGIESGRQIGLVNAQTLKLETEIIGL